MGLNINRPGPKQDDNIGTGDWANGYFDNWTPNTSDAKALEDISKTFLDLLPAKAALLTGSTLNNNITMYSAKLAEGLEESLYTVEINAGDTINDYTLVNNVVCTTIGFRAGKKNKPETYGILTLYQDETPISTYDMSTGVGTSSDNIITVTAINVYNTFWNQANVTLNLSSLPEGKQTYYLQHSEAGKTNPISFYRDSTPGNLTFEETPTASITERVTKSLSGITYLTLGTKIQVSYKSGIGIYNKAYRSDYVSKIIGTAISGVNINPPSVPNYDDQLEVIDEEITVDQVGYTGNNILISAYLYRPEKSISSVALVTEKFTTYGIVSTITDEPFQDEDKRLILDTTEEWVSTDELTNGNAQIRPGILEYGSSYVTKSGIQEYQRKFTKNFAANGSLTFGGFNPANISKYNTGDINILIKLDGSELYFDLGSAFGINNGDGSGNSLENSLGGMVSISGSTLNWTIGTNSTAGINDNQFRIIVIFRTNRYSITRITSA